ncbi:hypothetical protein BpHYR1_005850 [Brachionus plicatilis]|uniref:Uncharacterized protein n=1 Tax=Brachionus plicatilis TaxID=10195 RepID=A0A3M7P4D8_BRAPC|nr:hypothetical protein BpHYR1_005850 [Brachionus plicatilis]
MESDLVLLFSGKQLKMVNTKIEKREQDLKRSVDAYTSENMSLFLGELANLINDKVYNINKSRKKIVA